MEERPVPHLIVGAGVFGLSLAHELALRGNSVTVLDRHPPPVPDGSSVDISRIIRADYASPFYNTLALEAFEHWRTPVERGGFASWYHESGFVLMGENSDGASKYVNECKENLRQKGIPFRELANAKDLSDAVPPLAEAGKNIEGFNAYRNSGAGWADAGGAVDEMAKRCKKLGIKFIRGVARRLVIESDVVTGVELMDGSIIAAQKVTLATGAWTGYVVNMRRTASASAQPVAFIRISSHEAEMLKDIPVVLDLTSGWFVFPPTRAHSNGTEGWVLKIAQHGYGFATQFEGAEKTISAPRREGDNSKSSFIPSDAEKALREGLRRFFPRFADRPFDYRRLCWYTDTPEGDFIVDWHPKIKGLFIVTGGSGHGFKFLPILGKYTADCFERKESEELRKKWKLTLPEVEADGPMAGDGSRGGQPQRVLSRQEQAKL